MLLKNVVSIDIGSSLIKLVQLSGSLGKIRLEKVGVVDNPTSNFRTDRSGSGRNAIAWAIRHSLRKGRIKARDAVSSLSGSSIIIQYFKFPPLSEKELENAVRLEAQRVMGGKLNSMETDFQTLPQNQNETGGQEVLFAAVPKEMVQQRMQTLEQVGLNPIAVDIDCLALANCFLRLKNLTSDEQVMVLNLGARLISLGILGKDNLRFIRDISVDLDTPLDFQEKSSLERAVEEIRRSLHYYEDRARGNKVARIFLTGGNAVVSEISDLFLRALERPVEKWNPLEGLEFDPCKLDHEFEESQGYLLAIALGLSLREKYP
ncbi:MAG: type IV pilus biogenesis protein PilM [bacterium]